MFGFFFLSGNYQSSWLFPLPAQAPPSEQEAGGVQEVVMKETHPEAGSRLGVHAHSTLLEDVILGAPGAGQCPPLNREALLYTEHTSITEEGGPSVHRTHTSITASGPLQITLTHVTVD